MIRKVTPADAARIADIFNYYIEKTTVSFEYEPVSVADMRGRIEAISAEFPYFVYETDGRIVGYCYAHPWKERAAYRNTLETTVYLDTEATGQGIGQALMQRLADECRVMGFHSLIACITADNEGSINFHRRLGFSQVSYFREVGRKFDRWLDVVDYELILS